MGFVKLIIDNERLLDDIEEQFGMFEDYDVIVDEFDIGNPIRDITFFADKEDIEDKYVELCKKYPTERIDMSYDDEEGCVTYYENENGLGHECWTDHYDNKL